MTRRVEDRRRTWPPDIGAFLVRCLREAGSHAPSESLGPAAQLIEPGALVAAAYHHGVAPTVCSVLARVAGVPPVMVEMLQQAYEHQWQIHLRTLGDLAEVVPVLDGSGARWAVVKGPVLAEAVYADGMARSYVDLDVLVDRRALPVVLDALEGAGAAVSDRNWTMARSDTLGELGLALRHGTSLDLHWHLLNEARVRRAFSLSTGDLLSRTRRVWVNGVRTPTLDPADTVLHLTAHAALNGGHRLVWLKDLEQVIAHDAPDWDVLVERGRATGLGLLSATMLERARRILGAEVPSEVLGALAPRQKWRAVIRLADRLRPPEFSFGRALTGRTLVAATRRSSAASAAELAHAVVFEVARPLLLERAHPWRRRLVLGPNRSAPAPASRSAGEFDRAVFLRRLHDVAEASVEP